MEKKNYQSPKKRAQAVMYYRSCGNASETAKKYKISRPTLMKWVQEFPDITAISPAASAACVKAIEDASAIRLTFLREHYSGISEVIRKAILRANDLVDKADSLNTVVNAIERLSVVIKDFSPTDDPTQPNTTINLLQQTINKEK